ncbi:MAG: hypothetical protein LUF26_01420 [Firmicutes bacterium]|nr:hypothetical protein [Bacillota bacterium]
MLVDLKRIVAYICPFCSNISSKALSIFNFSGSEKVQLICPTHGCHETCVYITQKGSKYKLDIECPLCGETHTYSISKENFWNKPLITYKCPVAGIDIFFAGERREVEKTLDENSDVYSDVMDDFDDDDDPPFDLMYAIIERLHHLKDNHKISCVCGSSDAEFNIVNGNIVITCARCRRSRVIEPSEENLIGLLNARAIIIGNGK